MPVKTVHIVQSHHIDICLHFIYGTHITANRKNVPVEQMLKYLGYEKPTREMLEEYVQGIYVYDDGRVEVEWRKDVYKRQVSNRFQC